MMCLARTYSPPPARKSPITDAGGRNGRPPDSAFAVLQTERGRARPLATTITAIASTSTTTAVADTHTTERPRTDGAVSCRAVAPSPIARLGEDGAN